MKILIATDGSKFSEEAVERICRVVKNPENVSIKIISAYEEPMLAVAAPYAMPPVCNPILETEMKGLAAQAVFQAEVKIRERLPALKENLTMRVICGSPAQVIVEEAENWGADLVVVGSHGYGFWERMFLGSVSNAIALHAPCSVLIVRKNSGNNN
jgi:nucleotide-binding universal stress UspA family protein